MKGWVVAVIAACAAVFLAMCSIGGLVLMTSLGPSEPETYSTTYDDVETQTDGQYILNEVWEESSAEDREGICEEYIYDPVGSINIILEDNGDVLTYSEVETFLDEKCF